MSRPRAPGVTRNSHGESTISQDATGRWHGYVSMGLKDNGRRDRRHVSGARRAEVVAKVRALEEKRDAGTAGAAGKAPTVTTWLEHWLDTIAARRVRTSTLTRYRQLATHQLIPGIGHHRLDRLQPEHVEKLYAELSARGLAPATVRQAHRVLSRALKVAMQRGKVTRNVCTLVDSPTVDRGEVEPLTGAQARKILATATGTRNAARWSVALALGLRQGEALGLPWDALDLDAGTLTVRQALQRQAGAGLVLVAPKSRAGRRTIALPEQLRDALKAHRGAQLAERMAAGPEWHDHGLVFAQPNGRPIDPRADHRAWRALLVAADVRGARLHDARHTAATLLLLQGVPARVVMEILGHSQISLTLGTYSHVVPELAQDAARRMGDALWG
ncbi:tyrosine-type recombinase/integrase [Sporichthya sp.]|uniref:tyrosine-type recombinase/integrase n=1 Tax=Sporichthya sp. TaxID=65475 RepID=UPI0018346968|nr:tyrosine-type recombinase/integrase [Sporichthya sp.]MBA3744284.1 site-specific integrase [Sporichthya sp.]